MQEEILRVREQNRLRKRKQRSQHPLSTKVEVFNRKKVRDKVVDFKKRNGQKNAPFTVADLLKVIGNEPKCYLTGRKIDLNQPSTYHLDHIIPASKGGSNDISNVGLLCREANLAKNDMCPEDFEKICIEVLSHRGFKVEKIGRDTNS